ncbi:Ferredoxin-like protein [Thermobaculum terrenum ATCC BAA-798]|uniref:Ferredoxin-like protein n=1 Tax=Thermobaculum terrenum (strain ATCC BAA-798 / CCMEE 7001 / YNP1) TaxID=525904 RepID=D1CFR7_THET1|nr:(2Fe-2S) ferredoxin domain-containing protein [Thermobaculum terrenum]ACZ41773.1 Ferredoxin-like protein [Thermobaculum terrenum ATCC BAA-798]
MKYSVAICAGADCSKRNTSQLITVLEQALRDEGLEGDVLLRPAACSKLCELGPTLIIYPDRVWYGGVTPERLQRIVREHLKYGNPIREWITKDLGKRDTYRQDVNNYLDKLFG